MEVAVEMKHIAALRALLQSGANPAAKNRVSDLFILRTNLYYRLFLSYRMAP